MAIDVLNDIQPPDSPSEDEGLIVVGPTEAAPAVWCDRYYHYLEHGFFDLERPFCPYTSSVFGGLFAEQLVPMHGNVPYFWREHYAQLLDKLQVLGLDTYSCPQSDELRNSIELLAHRNHYPSHSTMHVIAWEYGSRQADLCVFQERRSNDLFDVISDPLYFVRSSPGRALNCCSLDQVGLNRLVETLSVRDAREAGVNGAVLLGYDGTIRRSTLGNLYLLHSDARLLYVSHNAGSLPDVMEGPLREVLSARNLRPQRTDGFTRQMVDEAFECFVCSSQMGLRPVMSLGSGKRFRIETVLRLSSDLRELRRE